MFPCVCSKDRETENSFLLNFYKEEDPMHMCMWVFSCVGD